MGIKKDFNTVKQIIADKGGELIKKYTKKSTQYITVKCNEDKNIWTARLSAILNKNQWCKVCYNRNRTKQVKIEDVESLVISKGFVLLRESEIKI